MTARARSPLTAAVGLAVSSARGLRRLPSLLGTLPGTVSRQVGATRRVVRERYDELALHGRDVLAARGRDVAARAEAGPDRTAALVDEAAAAAVEREPVQPAAVAPPEPAPPTPIGRTEPVVLSEDVLEEVAQLPSGAELGSAELPLADFDHITVPQLRGRLRRLTVVELVQLRDYESAHGSRLPVLTLLDNRIAKLSDSPAR